MIESPTRWHLFSVSSQLLKEIEILIGMHANPGDSGGILLTLALVLYLPFLTILVVSHTLSLLIHAWLVLLI